MSGQLLTMNVPGLTAIPERARGTVMSGAVLGAGYFLMYAKKGPKLFKKQRDQIMVGFGINFADKLLKAVAPTVATQVGVGDYVQIGDYVSVDDYVSIGAAPPLQDNITLAGYEGSGLEADLGLYQDLGLEQDLGVEMDLGGDDFADRHLGGVHRWQMQAPIGHKKYLAPVPPRSFTKEVPHISDAFDKDARLYTGIFSD